MTEHALTINFTPGRADLVDPYWLRMELVEPDDGQMTIGEAAAFIDALFDTSICNQKETKQKTPEKPDGPDWDRAFALMRLPMCNNIAAFTDGDPGAYDTQIRVYRSHQRELYKMVFSNGSAGAPRRVEERVTQTIDVKNQSSITLDTPIVKRPFVAWQDDGPDIHIMGNTLWWDGVVTGVLRAEFDTVFDLIDVHVHGIATGDSEVITGSSDDKWLGDGWYSGSEDGSELTDVQDTECTALAFYHYMYEELVLHKPELDESVTEDQAGDICRYAGSTHVTGSSGFGDPRYDEAACKADCAKWHEVGSTALAECLEACEKKCFERVRNINVCTCGGEEKKVVEDVTANCPPGYNEGSILHGGAVGVGRYQYIDCDGPDEVHSAAFYEQKCCEGPGNLGLPYCEEKHEAFTGGDGWDLENGKKKLKEKYGENVNVISVGPLSNQCGEKITTQNIRQKECCEFAEQIVVDGDNSVEQLDDYDMGVVVIYGGLDIIDVSVRGQGFYVDSKLTKRDITLDFSAGIPSDPKAIPIFTGDACGSATVTITDGCTTVTHTILATDGYWLSISDFFANCGDATSGIWGGHIYDPLTTFITEGGIKTYQLYYNDASYLQCIACGSSSTVKRCVSISKAVSDGILDVVNCPSNPASPCQFVHYKNDDPGSEPHCLGGDYIYYCPVSLQVYKWVC